MNRKPERNMRGKCENGNSFKILLLCLSIFITLSTTSYASQDASSEKGIYHQQSKHVFEIGPVINYFDYTEPDVDVDITGYMAGISGKYKYCSSTGFMLAFELEYTYDIDTEYEGGTWGGTPLKEDSKDWVGEARFITGGNVNLSNGLILNPYLGIGTRYWYNDIEGAGSYRRKTHYLYLPVGTGIYQEVSPNFKWGFNLEFDWLLWGRNRSYLGDADPGYTTVRLYQDSGYGIRASLPFTFKFVQIEPYIHYWDIDESDSEPLTYYGVWTGWNVIEPDNETTVYGIKLSFVF